MLETTLVGRLGLIDDDGSPRVLPVTFAVIDDAVWSAIDEKPKRVPATELARLRWLQARPRSALTVDRYSENWDELAWVQLLGETEIVDAAGHVPVIKRLAERYPAYRAGEPGGPLLRLRPERALCWRAEDPG